MTRPDPDPNPSPSALLPVCTCVLSMGQWRSVALARTRGVVTIHTHIHGGVTYIGPIRGVEPIAVTALYSHLQLKAQ